MRRVRRDLERLARLWGLMIEYEDALHVRRVASDASLIAALRALGAPFGSDQDIPGAIVQRERAPWTRGLDPITVVWEGGDPSLLVRLPVHLSDSAAKMQVCLEDGARFEVDLRLADRAPVDSAQIAGERFVAKRLSVARRLPLGRHRVSVVVGPREYSARVLCAPVRAWPLEGRRWGVFAPTYALRARANGFGAGDLGDLERLSAWASGRGAAVIATLPLLACFLDEPFEPSPYSPVSRRFWNEFFLDLEPLVAACPASVRSRAERVASGQETTDLRTLGEIDYRRVAAAKREVLELLSDAFWRNPGDERADFRRFLDLRPEVERYAWFRAAVEDRRTAWRQWSDTGGTGDIDVDKVPVGLYRYHLYAQWKMHEQLRALDARAKQNGPGLYLDLPVGSHPDGYDAWADRHCFLEQCSVGAPPDPLFTKGQNWGFAPYHPDRLSEAGLEPFRRCLEHPMRVAGVLRLDHVMWLHRLFIVPNGADAVEGVYLRFPAEALWAELALQSRRFECAVVGEDLGTVPSEVRQAMSERGVHRMYVAQFEVREDPDEPLGPVPENAVASLNTHDMPPFAAFWRGLDIDDRVALGLLDEAQAAKERAGRAALRQRLVRFLGRRGLHAPSSEAGATMALLTQLLAKSPARLVLVNLEDLWAETRPQNTPGTWRERPNWRRKFAHTAEDLESMSEVTDLFRCIEDLRRGVKVPSMENQNTQEG